MDMHPPSAPPLAVHGITHEAAAASAALQRLAAAHAALATMDDTAPTLSAPPPTDLDAFLAEYGTWRPSAEARLGAVLGEIVRADAALRVADATLQPEAGAVARRVADALAGDALDGLALREVWAGSHPIAGAIVATANDLPGRHVLFLPGQGWEAFSSEDQAMDAARRYLAGCIQAAPVAGMHADGCADAFDGDDVSLRAPETKPSLAWARRLLDVHATRIRQTWDDYRLDRDLPGAEARFSDRWLGYARLARILDVPGLLRAREARLLAYATNERLAHVPGEVANRWRTDTRAYTQLAADTAALHTALELEAPDDMAAFTESEIGRRLRALGIREASSELSVDVTHLPTGGSYEHLKHLVIGPDTLRQTLHALAWRGLSIMDAVQLRTLRSDGQAMQVPVAQVDLVAIVRDARIAARYREHLESQLRSGPAGRLAKISAIELAAARMRADASHARLSYYLADEPHSFRDDHAERGYRWVETVLDDRAPAKRRTVDGHAIVVRQLTYKGIALRDVVVIGTRDARSVPGIVVYTPDAPDGVAFREFDDRQALARMFLYAPAFREYLLDRLPSAFAEREPNGITRRFKGDRLAHWVLGRPGDASYTLTEEPFDERDVTGDFIDAGYDAMVDQRIHDAHHVEAEAQRQWTFSPIGTDPLAGFAVDIAQATLSAPARVRKALDRFYQEVKAGHATDAYLAFTDAWVSGLDLVGPLWAAGSGRFPLIRATRGAAPQPASARVDLRGPRFETRYATRRLAVNEFPDSEGFHVIQGRRHVSQDGQLYPVRFDDNNHVWRLERPAGSLDANFTGPAVQRIAGEWTYAQGIGLQGGSGRGLRERLRRALRLGDAPPRQGAGAAQPAAPVEPPARRPSLPEALEPHRPEIEDILRDNPSATFRYRTGSNDSLHLRIDMPSRSAMVFDDGIASDLASLDAGQRRQFLHELEARVPNPHERSMLLAQRGWADGGRRVGSPGQRRWRGDDGQDPAISSTSDPAGSPAERALSPQHETLWGEAIDAARLAVPAVDRAAAGAGVATPLTPPDWPRRFWVYTTEPPAQVHGISGGAEWLVPGDTHHFYDPGQFRVTTLPPGTPLAQLDDVLGTAAAGRGGGRNPTGYWIEMDSRYMHQAYWRTEHRMERRLLASGEYAYTLRTRRRDLYLPAGFSRSSGGAP